MSNVLILVGTVGGTAHKVAETLASVLTEQGYIPHITDMEKASPETVTQHTHIVVSVATYDEGTIPPNAVPFYNALKEQAPDLSHVRFSICALGDTSYGAKFCEAGKVFEEFFALHGATRVYDRLDLNISDNLTDAALDSVQNWGTQVAKAL